MKELDIAKLLHTKEDDSTTGKWLLSDVHNMFTAAPGSRVSAGRKTLVFRPTNWMVMTTTKPATVCSTLATGSMESSAATPALVESSTEHAHADAAFDISTCRWISLTTVATTISTPSTVPQQQQLPAGWSVHHTVVHRPATKSGEIRIWIGAPSEIKLSRPFSEQVGSTWHDLTVLYICRFFISRHRNGPNSRHWRWKRLMLPAPRPPMQDRSSSPLTKN